MKLTKYSKWNPFGEMEELQNRLSSLFQKPSRGGEEPMTLGEWMPAVDIAEDDKEYLFKCELPEIRKEDITVTLEHGVLTISGERKFEKEEKGRRYHRVEREYGTFTRSFSVPEDISADKITAEFKDGVLLVHVPKSEHAQPKSIDIKVS